MSLAISSTQLTLFSTWIGQIQYPDIVNRHLQEMGVGVIGSNSYFSPPIQVLTDKEVFILAVLCMRGVGSIPKNELMEICAKQAANQHFVHSYTWSEIDFARLKMLGAICETEEGIRLENNSARHARITLPRITHVKSLLFHAVLPGIASSEEPAHNAVKSSAALNKMLPLTPSQKLN